MKDEKEIRDDEIRIIGNDTTASQPPVRRLWGWVAFGLATVVLVIVLVLAIRNGREAVQPDVETYFNPQPAPAVTEARMPQRLGQTVDSLAGGFSEIRDTTINDIPLRIYIPHNAEMTLHVGRLDKRDTTIVYAAQAGPTSGATTARSSAPSCCGVNR